MVTKPASTPVVPRGRHAPPLEVRLSVQRRRLFDAAAKVICDVGYAEASAEAISREAGMSKATFYEHFANKEECILALLEEAAAHVVQATREASAAAERQAVSSYSEWVSRRLRAFLGQIAANPAAAQALLVEVIGAGPRAAERRDRVLDLFADGLMADNAVNAPRLGAPTFASRDDAYAVVGAIAEVVARRLREGRADDVQSLEPTLRRLVLGILEQGAG